MGLEPDVRADNGTVREGRVTITRTSSTRGPDTVGITIRIGNVDVEARMTLENFALAVTGQARIEADVRAFPVPGRAVTSGDWGPPSDLLGPESRA